MTDIRIIVPAAGTPDFSQSASPFTANNPTDYVPRVKGVAGWGMDSAFGTAKKGESSVTVRVQVVSNLNASGSGSLDAAVTLPDTTRTVVVFDTSGWLTDQPTIDSGEGNKTIAGQTAPGDGFFIDGRIRCKSTNDVLIWHIGAAYGTYDGTIDPIEITNNCEDIALVNCAGWFGGDSCIEVGVGNGTYNRRITQYNCIMSHGLGLTSTTQQRAGIVESEDITVARTLYTHCRARTPLADIETGFDSANNIIANFNPNNGTVQLRGQGTAHAYNIHQNVFIQGPNTPSGETCVVTESDWTTGQLYYPTSLNKYVGTLTEFSNSASATLSGSPLTAGIAHGSVVTDMSSWSDAEAIDAILNNCGPRPASALAYLDLIKSQVVNMEDGTGDTGGHAGTDPLNVYDLGGGQFLDTISSESVDNLARLDAFLSANYSSPADYSVTDSGDGTYKTYSFTVGTYNGRSDWTAIDQWLNIINDDVMRAGWET